MTVATLVRYRVHPGEAERNAELIRAVYAELSALAPPDFRYMTFRDDDAFVHVAVGDMPPMTAFRAFQEGIAERCAEPPRVTRELVGRYDAPPSGHGR
jgi:hypothetical protein